MSDVKIRVAIDSHGAETGARRVNSALGRIHERAGELKKRIFSLQSAIAGVGIGMLGRKFIQFGADFDRSMNVVRVVSGATEDQFNELSAAAKRMGATTEYSASQAADAEKYLAMAGLEVQQSLKALPQMLDLATAGQLDLARAADISTNILTQMGLRVEELTRVNDALIAVQSTANTSVEEAAQAFTYAGSQAKKFHVDVEELNAMIGLLASSGIKGSMAGTTLRQSMIKLLNPTKEAQEILDKYNIQTKKTDGTVRSFVDILYNMADAELGVTESTKIFGARAQNITNVISGGADALRNYIQEIRNMEGVSASAADTIRDDMQGVIDELSSTFQARALEVWDEYRDEVRGSVESITKYLRENKDEIKDYIDKTVEFGGNVGEVLSSLKPVATIIGDIFSSAAEGWDELPEIIQTMGFVGALTYGKAGVAIAISAGVMADWAADLGKAFALAERGYIDYTDVIFSTHGGIKELIAAHEDEIESLHKQKTALEQINDPWERLALLAKQQAENTEDATTANEENAKSFGEITVEAERLISTLSPKTTKPNTIFDAITPEQLREGKRLIEAMRKPIEILDDRLMHINELYEAGAINAETFFRALEDANTTYLDSVEIDTEETTDEINRLWEHTAENIHDIFATEIKDMLDGELDSFGDFFDSIFDMFKGMVAEMAATDLSRAIFGSGVEGMGLFTGEGGDAGFLKQAISGISDFSGITGEAGESVSGFSQALSKGLGTLSPYLGAASLGVAAGPSIYGATGLKQGEYSDLAAAGGGALGGGLGLGLATGFGSQSLGLAGIATLLAPGLGLVIGAIIAGLMSGAIGHHVGEPHIWTEGTLGFTEEGLTEPQASTHGWDLGIEDTMDIGRRIEGGEKYKKGWVTVQQRGTSGEKEFAEGLGTAINEMVYSYTDSINNILEKDGNEAIQDALKEADLGEIEIKLGSYHGSHIEGWLEEAQEQIGEQLTDATNEIFEAIDVAILGEGIEDIATEELMQELQKDGENIAQTWERFISTMDYIPDSTRLLEEKIGAIDFDAESILKEAGLSGDISIEGGRIGENLTNFINMADEGTLILRDLAWSMGEFNKLLKQGEITQEQYNALKEEYNKIFQQSIDIEQMTADAFDELVDELEYVMAVIGPAVQDGLMKAVNEDMSYEAFREGLVTNLEEQMKQAVIQAAQAEFTESVIQSVFKDVVPLEDLMADYFAGDITLDEFNEQWDTLMDNIADALPEEKFEEFEAILDKIGVDFDGTSTALKSHFQDIIDAEEMADLGPIEKVKKAYAEYRDQLKQTGDLYNENGEYTELAKLGLEAYNIELGNAMEAAEEAAEAERALTSERISSFHELQASIAGADFDKLKVQSHYDLSEWFNLDQMKDIRAKVAAMDWTEFKAWADELNVSTETLIEDMGILNESYDEASRYVLDLTDSLNTLGQSIRAQAYEAIYGSEALNELIKAEFETRYGFTPTHAVEAVAAGADISNLTDKEKSDLDWAIGYVSSQFEGVGDGAKDLVDTLRDQAAAIKQQISNYTSIQDVIDSIMGGETGGGPTSKAFFERRYEEMLAGAQQNPEQIDAFTRFVESKYLPFMEDYGGVTAGMRSNVLSDLTALQEEIAGEKTLTDLYNQLEEVNDRLEQVRSEVDSAGTSAASVITGPLMEWLADVRGITDGGTTGGGSYEPYSRSIMPTISFYDSIGNISELEDAYRSVIDSGQLNLFKNALAAELGIAPDTLLSDFQDYFGFDSGGYHQGGLRIVGESGPELEFTGPSRISSNEDSTKMIADAVTQALGGRGGSGNINVYVKIGDREIKDMTVEVLEDEPEAQHQIRRVANG